MRREIGKHKGKGPEVCTSVLVFVRRRPYHVFVAQVVFGLHLCVGIVTDWATFRFLFRLRRNTRFDTLSIICSQRDDERAECYKVYHIPMFGVVCGPTSTELKTARTYA